MTSVDSKFNFPCGRPHGVEPPPRFTCVRLSLTSSPPCGRHKWMAPYISVMVCERWAKGRKEEIGRNKERVDELMNGLEVGSWAETWRRVLGGRKQNFAEEIFQ